MASRVAGLTTAASCASATYSSLPLGRLSNLLSSDSIYPSLDFYLSWGFLVLNNKVIKNRARGSVVKVSLRWVGLLGFGS